MSSTPPSIWLGAECTVVRAADLRPWRLILFTHEAAARAVVPLPAPRLSRASPFHALLLLRHHDAQAGFHAFEAETQRQDPFVASCGATSRCPEPEGLAPSIRTKQYRDLCVPAALHLQVYE